MSDLSKLQKGLIVLTMAIGVVFTIFIIELYFGQRCAMANADSFGNRCGHPVANFLYDFQSLIGGILAVAAAFFTIRQMQATDSRQAKHHRELIDLQLFQQQIAIQQAADLIRALFISSTQELVFLKTTIVQHKALAGDVYAHSENIAEAIKNIQSFLHSPAIARVEPFLGGDVVLKILRARSAIDRLSDFGLICTFDDPNDPNDLELTRFVEFYELRYLDIVKQTEYVLSSLNHLNAELKQLKIRFGTPPKLGSRARSLAKS